MLTYISTLQDSYTQGGGQFPSFLEVQGQFPGFRDMHIYIYGAHIFMSHDDYSSASVEGMTRSNHGLMKVLNHDLFRMANN